MSLPVPAARPVLTWSPHPILAAADRRLYATPFTEGETIERYLARIGVPADAPGILAVDGQIVPRALWPIARPKPGTVITLRAAAEGGDGSNPIAVIATLALAIVAPWAAGQILGTTFGAFAATALGGTSIFLGVATGAIMLVGGMVINALFAPPVAQLSDGRAPEVSPTYSLSGGQNMARPYGPLPLVLGKHRVFPDLASKPYTEFAGDDQYLIQLFNFGYGTLRLSDFRIGQTPLTSYTDIVTEESGADGVLSLFPGNVDSTAGGVLGSGTPPVTWPTPTDDTAWVVRTSGTNAIRLAVDIEASIYALTADGPQPWSITFMIEYRVPGGSWTSMLYPAAEVYVENASLKPVRRTFYSPALAPGQYEVRVKRRYGEDGRNIPETQFEDSATWATLRTYQLDPITYEKQTRYGIFVKATGQLNGVLARVSALAESLVPAWNGSAWVDDYSSNPAWLFLYFARGDHAADGRLLWGAGLADARIDIEGLKLWGAYCTAHGLEFNAVIDRGMSVAEVLNAIARCGRASLTWATGKLGVTWDDSEAPVVAQFGMSSIAAGTFEIQWASGQLADEMVIQFADRDADYEQSEVRALAPGVSVPTLTQTVQWLGATSRAMAGKMANLLLANNLYRSRKISFETDAEGLVVTRGDRVLLSHDLTQWGYSGRLVAATTTVLTLDRAVPRVLGTAAWIALVAPDGAEIYKQLTDVASGDYEQVTLASALTTPWRPGTDFPSSPVLDWKWRFAFTATPGLRVKIAALEPLAERRVRVTCVDDPVEYHGMSVLGYTYVARTATQPTTPTISGLTLTEALVISAGKVATHLVATWNATGEVGLSRVRWHSGDGVWIVIGDVAGRRAEFAVPDNVDVTVEVLLFNSLGQSGAGGRATATWHVLGKTLPPPDVSSFVIDGQTLSWASVSAVDLAGYRIRYHAGINLSWSDAIALHEGLVFGAPYTMLVRPAGQTTLMIKAVDTSGNESAGVAVIVTDFGDALTDNIVLTHDFEALGWLGTLTGGAIAAGQLEADAGNLMWSTPSKRMWSYSTGLMWLGVYDEMSYADALTVGTAEVGARLTLDYTALGSTIAVQWRPLGQAMLWGVLDTELMWTDDAQAMWTIPDFSPWPGEATAAADTYEFRIVTGAGSMQGIVSAFVVNIDVPDIVERFNDVAIGAGGTRLTLTNQYRVIRNVLLTLQDDAGTAATVKAIDKDAALGPLVQCFTTSGTGVAGLIDATIQGY